MAKRILVVEDNDLNRKLFCDLLRANGFAVEPVADGESVIERTRQFVPNLVIMDISLPTVSGARPDRGDQGRQGFARDPDPRGHRLRRQRRRRPHPPGGGGRLSRQAGVDRAVHGGGKEAGLRSMAACDDFSAIH